MKEWRECRRFLVDAKPSVALSERRFDAVPVMVHRLAQRVASVPLDFVCCLLRQPVEHNVGAFLAQEIGVFAGRQR